MEEKNILGEGSSGSPTKSFLVIEKQKLKSDDFTIRRFINCGYNFRNSYRGKVPFQL